MLRTFKGLKVCVFVVVGSDGRGVRVLKVPVCTASLSMVRMMVPPLLLRPTPARQAVDQAFRGPLLCVKLI
jgi:hypothetical protein